MNSDSLKINTNEKHCDFMTELEACKMWTNGSVEEYKTKIIELKQKLREIEVRFLNTSSANFQNLKVHKKTSFFLSR